MTTPYVLVIGAAGIDTKAHALEKPVPATSVSGKIMSSSGGVARNVAENLARLGEAVVLLTALGDDARGVRVKDRLAEAKVDTGHIVTIPGARTATYVALFDTDRNPIYSIHDMTVMEMITPQMIYHKRSLFKDANLVVIDSNLSEKTIAAIFKQAEQQDVAVVADPTSTKLAGKLKPHLDQLYMITPNADEAEVLAGQKIQTSRSALRTAKKLVELGVEIVVITLGEKGVVYATDDTSGHIPGLSTEIINLTGVGDALTAATIFGLLNDLTLDEAVRLGANAATLTLRSEESVLKNLTLDLLYEL